MLFLETTFFGGNVETYVSVIDGEIRQRALFAEEISVRDIGPESPLEGSGVSGGPGRPKSLLLSPQDEASHSTIPASRVAESSRLSKTLEEIISDRDALPYLLQYLNYHKAGHLLQFWLDAQSFQAATLMRLQSSNSRQSSCQKSSSREDFKSLEKTLNEKSKSDENVESDFTAEESVGRTSPSDECGDSLSANFKDKKGGSCLLSSPPGRVDPYRGPSNERDHITSNNQSEAVPAISLSQSIPSHITERAADCAPGSADTLSVTNVQPDSDPSVDGAPQRLTAQQRLKKSIEQDAVNIFSRYISKDCLDPIEVSDRLRDEVVRGICREDGEVDPRCFSACQQHVVQRLQDEYYSDFIQSAFHCQHQVDLLTGTAVNLGDILYNESAMFYFMEYMEQEGALALLQCWQDLHSFEQLLLSQGDKYDPIQAQNDAMVLYDKYFSLQASLPLGFSDKQRFEIESNICREEGPLPNCFHNPKSAVLHSMHKVYFHPFLASQVFYKYLSDLINTVQMAQDVPQFRRSRRGSDDASSEHSTGSHSTGSESVSVSSRNTLLAGAHEPATSSTAVKKALNRIEDDMRIDNMLLNPDALWERPQAGKMSLGRIDELGHFVSEFAPQPDPEKKKKGAFFKRNRNKETQEEMALKIAQMIVSDITAVTQSETHCDSEDNA